MKSLKVVKLKLLETHRFPNFQRFFNEKTQSDEIEAA